MKSSNSNSRVVILGAAGFIGFHLMKHFLQSGFEVIPIDNFVRGEFDSELKKVIAEYGVDFRTLDLSLISSYDNLFNAGDLVYNCAALNGTQNFYSHPYKVIENSAIPAIYAAKFAALADCARYTYFGSSESYAGGVALDLISIPTPEDIPLTIPNVAETRWSYAGSKTMGELATFAAKVEFGLEIQILRIHNIYGPRMGDKHVIPDLIKKFIQGNSEVHGQTETRSFFYIDDLVQVVSGLANLVDYPEVLNIGSSEEIKIASLAELIMELMGINLILADAPEFSASVKRRCPDVTLLRSILTYPETSLTDGLTKTIQWYREN
jgi:nucleoside-diphosphate-sugar epimerase